MSSQELRAGQLLTTFGPGALVDFVDESVIIAGLKFWRYDPTEEIPTIQEPRLASLLRQKLKRPYIELRLPPIKTESFAESRSYVKGFQFPEWLQVQHAFPSPNHTGALRRRLVHKKELDPAGKYVDERGKKYNVVALRFVQACAHGHISDIDWNYVVHRGRECSRRAFWLEEGSTSSGLASIKIGCECGMEVNLSDLFKDGSLLGPCTGARPWLGFGTKERCGERNKAVVRNASNVYYPQLLTVISIPEAIDPVWAGVNAQWGILQAVSDTISLASFLGIPQVHRELGAYPLDEIFAAIQAKKKGEEPVREENIKEIEFHSFSCAPQELVSEIPGGDYFAREIVEKAHSLDHNRSLISKIVAVHKLREVSALYGFTRLEPIAKGFDGEPDPGADLDVQLAKIGIDENWLPAIENRGEGLFLQFDPTEIGLWKDREAVKNYENELREAFMQSPIGQGAQIPFPGAEYYLAHSLCHLLMNTLTLECGYPSSSLKERVYLCEEGLGFLIYTASPDADGTLGGLVQQGKKLSRFLAQAIDAARLCSNDPLCASHKPSDPDGRYLSGAACHSCLHVPETACEQWNQFLDRNLVVETLERKGTAYFS